VIFRNTTNHGSQEKVTYNEALFTVRDTFKNRKSDVNINTI